MYDDLWENSLNLLQYDPRVNTVIFTSVIKNIKQVSFNENGFLILSCRDEYTKTLVKSKGLDAIIKDAIKAVYGKDLIIQYIVDGDKAAEIVSSVAATKVIESKKEATDLTTGLSDEYTFENFIVGECNKFAHASAISVANHPGSTQFNPLFLWGNSGLGKTHLMKAIGYKISQDFTDKRIFYTTCEDFVSSYVACIKSNNYESFRTKYRNIDVLMIDDIQFLINKIETQKEFFNTFESLVNSGKQIIITCDKAPNNLVELDERLTSRFQNGMTMDIQPPDFETRKAIFTRKVITNNLNITEDIIDYVCENITKNVRELNGAYNKVSSLYALYNGDLELEMVKKALSSIISPNNKKNLTPEMIIDTTSKYYDIPADTLKSKLRTREIHIARSVAMYMCRELLEFEYKKIGSFFGGRKHSTVINGCNTVEEDKELLADVEEIKKRILD